jgi:hypothetical protein
MCPAEPRWTGEPTDAGRAELTVPLSTTVTSQTGRISPLHKAPGTKSALCFKSFFIWRYLYVCDIPWGREPSLNTKLVYACLYLTHLA